MYPATTIANEFLRLANAQGNSVTHMKLQKLVYLAHGWHLALCDGATLINEQIEAWDHGPVIRALYAAFASYGRHIIDDLYQDETDHEPVTPLLPHDAEQSRSLIDGVMSVSVAPAVGRLSSQGSAVCRGLGIDIGFDRRNYSGNGLFLFASVLERFLALYCSINSFTQFTALEKGQEGELRKWPPRAGEKVLL